MGDVAEPRSVTVSLAESKSALQTRLVPQASLSPHINLSELLPLVYTCKSLCFCLLEPSGDEVRG